MGGKFNSVGSGEAPPRTCSVQDLPESVFQLLREGLTVTGSQVLKTAFPLSVGGWRADRAGCMMPAECGAAV